MKKDKKKYVAPTIEVIEMEVEGPILSVSGREKFVNKSGINLLPDASEEVKSIWSRR